MEITLTPELENFINKKIKSGKFSSPNEVINEILRSSFEAEEANRAQKREDLRREIQKGIDAIREGNYKTYAVDELDNFADEIIERGMKKLEKKHGEK